MNQGTSYEATSGAAMAKEVNTLDSISSYERVRQKERRVSMLPVP